MTLLVWIALWIGIGLVATNICHALDYFFCGRYVRHEPFLYLYPQALLAGVLAAPLVVLPGILFVASQGYKYMKEHNWTNIRTMRANFENDQLAEEERGRLGEAYKLIMGLKWEKHACLGRKKSFERTGSKP